MALAIFQRTVVDSTGAVQSGASVEVRIQSSNALASIYSDRAGVTPLANPFTTGSDGLAQFFASGDAYKITATKDAFSEVWEYVAIGTAAEFDIDDLQQLIEDALAGDIDDLRLLANVSGDAAPASANTLTAILDAILGDTRGLLMRRGASAWEALAVGAAGQYLRSGGAGADAAWADLLWTRVIKSADQSRTSSTAYADVTDLQFAVAANKTYAIRATTVVASGAGGMKLAFNGPASPTKLRFGLGGGATVTAYDTDFALSLGSGTSTNSIVGLIGNGANAGAVTLRLAQNSSNAAATTIEKGSWLEYALLD